MILVYGEKPFFLKVYGSAQHKCEVTSPIFYSRSKVQSQELKKQRFDFEIPDNGDVIVFAAEGLENVGVCSLPETSKRR